MAPRIMVTETDIIFKTPLIVRPITTRFTLHHIGEIPRSLNPYSIDARMINGWHLDRGWSGIGYHYVVKRDGVVERGRPRIMMGAHDEGENACSIGICVVGDFTLDIIHPAPLQMISLECLLADLYDIYQKPEAPYIELCGHRDHEPPETPTECPGDGLYDLIPLISDKVRGLRGTI